MSHQPHYPPWPAYPPPRRGVHPALLIVIGIGGILVVGFLSLLILVITLTATGYQTSAKKAATATARSAAGVQILPTAPSTPTVTTTQIAPTVPAIAATSTPLIPTTRPVSTGAANAPTGVGARSPIEEDKARITEIVRQTLADNVPSIKITDFANVDYSSVGWTRKEPLIRDVRLDSGGVLSVWFSAWPSGNRYMDAGDYGRAELETVEILGKLKTLKLNTTLTDISVAAWAPLPMLGNCKTQRIDRMVFVRLRQAQFPLFTYEQWDNLGSNDVFAEMQKRGITTEIYTPYKTCL